MVANYGIRWMYLCAMAAVIYTIAGCGEEVDIAQEDGSPYVNVYTGTFKRGGVYKMFHSRISTIMNVKYASHMLVESNRYWRPIDTYVQTYSRGEYIYVMVTRIYDNPTEEVFREYFKIHGSYIFKRIRQIEIDEFVGSEIFVKLDLKGPLIHPFIVKSIISGNEPRIRQFRPVNRGHKIVPNVWRVRRRGEVIFISPITNIDSVVQYQDGPMASVISRSTRVKCLLQCKSITLWILYYRYKMRQSLKIPPIKDGIFKPDYMMVCSQFRNIWQAPPVRRNLLNIDVASLEVINHSIVILHNLRRGLWLYTQYAVIIRKDFIYVVIDSVVSGDQKIYTTSDDEFITHVEVFDHVCHGYRYVVINIEKVSNESSHFDGIKKLYMRKSVEDGDVYHDINDIWLEQYIDFLYNIDVTVTSCDDIDFTGITDFLNLK